MYGDDFLFVWFVSNRRVFVFPLNTLIFLWLWFEIKVEVDQKYKYSTQQAALYYCSSLVNVRCSIELPKENNNRY